MKNIIPVLIAAFLMGALCDIIAHIIINKHHRHRKPYYVELQIEEPLATGDTLQVLDITHGVKDTIWIGYFH